MQLTTSRDDDELKLSAEALAALNEFYEEQAIIKKQEEALQLTTTNNLIKVQENWQLSQFWYDHQTADTLAKEVIRSAGQNGRILCISCPTIFNRLKEIKPENICAKLFEYDTRFSAFGDDFTFYDYNEPLNNIPESWNNTFDIVIADPPFLSKECLEKVAETITALAKEKIIVCTGATMESSVIEFLKLKTCNFQPKHERQLQNEFKCYANYDLDASIAS